MTEWVKDKLGKLTSSDGGGEVSQGGELSSGPNSLEQTETSIGGADSVPGTPDATPSVDLGERDTDRAEGSS